MQLNKWLVPAASAALGFGFLVITAASADTQLYTSGGFEPAASYVPLSSLAGQPATSGQAWTDYSGVTGTASASSFVLSYGGADPNNLQYAEVFGQNLNPGDAAYFAPTPYTSASKYDATGKQLAVRFTMAFQSASNAFVGVTAFDDVNAIGLAGVNGAGKISGVTLTPAGQAFTATQNAFYQYELLLDYQAQTYSVYEAPANNVSPFVLMGSAPFQATTTKFTDADLSVFAADPSATGTVTGVGFFDFYTISVVPEPTSLSMVALGLLYGYRRRRI